MTEHQKFVAHLAVILLAGRHDPHPSAVQESVRIAKDVCAEAKRSVQELP